MLLEKGISVSAKSQDGDTALHLAVKGQRFNIIDILLRYGADFTIKNQVGKSCLDLEKEKFVGKNKEKWNLCWFFKGIERINVQVKPITKEAANPSTIQMNSVSTVKELIVQIEYFYDMKVDKLEQNGVALKKTKSLNKEFQVEAYLSKKETISKPKKQKKK